LRSYYGIVLILDFIVQQLKHSASILLARAENLAEVVNKERTFWSEVLALRRNNWCLTTHVYAGKEIFVNYGYQEGMRSLFRFGLSIGCDSKPFSLMHV
jgi:hypothetical protein